MRLDKFLKLSRVIKRRTVANDVCQAGRVSVNGRPAKAGTKLEPRLLRDFNDMKFEAIPAPY